MTAVSRYVLMFDIGRSVSTLVWTTVRSFHVGMSSKHARFAFDAVSRCHV